MLLCYIPLQHAQLSEGDSSKIDTLLATISTLELTLENTRAESQRQASELQASRAEMGLLKLRLNDKVCEGSPIRNLSVLPAFLQTGETSFSDTSWIKDRVKDVYYT